MVHLRLESSVIYDLLGNRIKKVFSGKISQGTHFFNWDGKDDQLKVASGGIYICRFTGVSEDSEKRMDKNMKLVLMK